MGRSRASAIGRSSPGRSTRSAPRPLSGHRGSPRPATVRRRPPPARIARYKPTRASTRHRGDDPAGRSPGRPPRWPSDRRVRKCWTRQRHWVNPANIAGDTTEGPGPDEQVASPSRGSSCSTPRGPQAGAQWNSSGSRRLDAKALHGSALLDASRHVRASITSTLLPQNHPCRKNPDRWRQPHAITGGSAAGHMVTRPCSLVTARRMQPLPQKFVPSDEFEGSVVGRDWLFFLTRTHALHGEQPQ